MKQFLLFAFATISITSVQAQPKTIPKPVAPVLKNISDSASYAIGVSVANFYKEQGMKTLNTALITKAIQDIMGNKTPAFDNNTANSVLNNFITQLHAEKSKGTIQAGEKFLADNKKRTGVTTTATGLQYEVIKEGSGERPTTADQVSCHYRGSFIDGKEFENSYDGGQPITFALTGVIRGWTEGLQLMTPGSKYKFYIPYTLGYGASDYGRIPGGSTLVFEIELLEVKKKG